MVAREREVAEREREAAERERERERRGRRTVLRPEDQVGCNTP